MAHAFGLSSEEHDELERGLDRMAEIARSSNWSSNRDEFMKLQARLNGLVPPGRLP
jgi:hypothetical protein